MRLNFAVASLVFFGLSIALWILLTLFESALIGISLMTERVLTFLLLVLPAGIGVLLGVMSFIRRQGQVWLASIGVALNLLLGFFQLLVILFSG